MQSIYTDPDYSTVEQFALRHKLKLVHDIPLLGRSRESSIVVCVLGSGEDVKNWLDGRPRTFSTKTPHGKVWFTMVADYQPALLPNAIVLLISDGLNLGELEKQAPESTPSFVVHNSDTVETACDGIAQKLASSPVVAMDLSKIFNALSTLVRDVASVRQ